MSEASVIFCFKTYFVGYFDADMGKVIQAKDIQKLVGISKSRYEYLATKIGISPDVKEAEGTGRSHLYSTRNLLQFAFVHHANDLGLTPMASKAMLKALDKFHSAVEPLHLSLPIYHGVAIDISGDDKDQFEFSESFVGYKVQNEDFEFKLFYIRKSDHYLFLLRTGNNSFQEIYWVGNDDEVHVHKKTKDDLSLERILLEIFQGAIGYITIDLGEIKRQIHMAQSL